LPKEKKRRKERKEAFLRIEFSGITFFLSAFFQKEAASFIFFFDAIVFRCCFYLLTFIFFACRRRLLPSQKKREEDEAIIPSSFFYLSIYFFMDSFSHPFLNIFHIFFLRVSQSFLSFSVSFKKIHAFFCLNFIFLPFLKTIDFDWLFLKKNVQK
jgi:hypothetical protein